ncbi:uncharacterized protein LOC119658917 isoform X2 [Hermetia illucens]|uniref:uncharacterized protein LOC119658917 isoform X2 n=1 Tax=Hermetia illucens TaxID=343691 RepID=UPI0018CC29B2|nr:uncharacterized protein LOC119658917 isoform X2 [Hermetia illucens]XP_037922662.1 uncharacterized protein LOC119658917 isoform X2 [Hermetia illucens]
MLVFGRNMELTDDDVHDDYPGENDDDRRQDRLTRASIISAAKTFGATPPRSVNRNSRMFKRRTVGTPFKNKLEFKENSIQKTVESKNTSLLKCQSSGMVLTSYSPTITPKNTPKSFACVMSNRNTPKSAYGTPRSILSEVNTSGTIESLNSTPKTPLSNLCSMHLIDFTTPDVYKTPLQKRTPLFKSALKNSAARSATKATFKVDLKTPAYPALKSSVTKDKLNNTTNSLSRSMGKGSANRFSVSMTETPKTLTRQRTSTVGSVKAVHSLPRITSTIKRKSLNVTTPLKTPKAIFGDGARNTPGNSRHSCIKVPKSSQKKVLTSEKSKPESKNIRTLNRSTTFILDSPIVLKKENNNKKANPDIPKTANGNEESPFKSFTIDDDSNPLTPPDKKTNRKSKPFAEPIIEINESSDLQMKEDLSEYIENVEEEANLSLERKDDTFNKSSLALNLTFDNEPEIDNQNERTDESINANPPRKSLRRRSSNNFADTTGNGILSTSAKSPLPRKSISQLNTEKFDSSNLSTSATLTEGFGTFRVSDNPTEIKDEVSFTGKRKPTRLSKCKAQSETIDEEARIEEKIEEINLETSKRRKSSRVSKSVSESFVNCHEVDDTIDSVEAEQIVSQPNDELGVSILSTSAESFETFDVADDPIEIDEIPSSGKRNSTRLSNSKVISDTIDENVSIEEIIEEIDSEQSPFDSNTERRKSGRASKSISKSFEHFHEVDEENILEQMGSQQNADLDLSILSMTATSVESFNVDGPIGITDEISIDKKRKSTGFSKLVTSEANGGGRNIDILEQKCLKTLTPDLGKQSRKSNRISKSATKLAEYVQEAKDDVEIVEEISEQIVIEENNKIFDSNNLRLSASFTESFGIFNTTDVPTEIKDDHTNNEKRKSVRLTMSKITSESIDGPNSSTTSPSEVVDQTNLEAFTPDSNRGGTRKSSRLSKMAANLSEHFHEGNDDEVLCQAVSPSLHTSTTNSRSQTRRSTRLVNADESRDTKQTMKSPRNDLSNVSGVKHLCHLESSSKSPILCGIKELVKTPKPVKDINLIGVRELVNSPKSRNELDNVVGVKELFNTPIRNELSDFVGIKELIHTPKPNRGLDDPKGMKELFNTPSRDELANFVGVKELLHTPKADDEIEHPKGLKELFNTPNRDELSDFIGVKELLHTPNPTNGLNDPNGMKELFNTPARDDLTDVFGVKELVNTPKPDLGLTDPKGMKELFNTPAQNDLSNVKGVKELLKTPYLSSPQLGGVRELLKTPYAPVEDNTDGLSEIFKTPAARAVMVLSTPKSVAVERSANLSGHLLRTPKEVDVLEDIEDVEDIYQTPISSLVCSRTETIESKPLSPEESFDRLAGKPIVRRTYGRTSTTPRILPIPIGKENSVNNAKTDIEEWINNVQNVEGICEDSENVSDSPAIKMSNRPLAASSSIKPATRRSQRVAKDFPKDVDLNEMSGIEHLDNTMLSTCEISRVSLESDVGNSISRINTETENVASNKNSVSRQQNTNLNTPQKSVHFVEHSSKPLMKVTPQIRRLRNRVSTPYAKKQAPNASTKDPFGDLSIQFIDESTVNASDVENSAKSTSRYKIRKSGRGTDFSLELIESNDESSIKRDGTTDDTIFDDIETISVSNSAEKSKLEKRKTRKTITENECVIFISDDEGSCEFEVVDNESNNSLSKIEKSRKSEGQKTVEFIALNELSAISTRTLQTPNTDAFKSQLNISNIVERSNEELTRSLHSLIHSSSMQEEEEEKLLELYELEASGEKNAEDTRESIEAVYVDVDSRLEGTRTNGTFSESFISTDNNTQSQTEETIDIQSRRRSSRRITNQTSEILSASNSKQETIDESRYEQNNPNESVQSVVTDGGETEATETADDAANESDVFSNFITKPATKIRLSSKPQTPQVEKVKRTQKSRKTLGATTDASPIDLEREKMNLEFSNFDMNRKENMGHGSQTPQVEKVKQRTQNLRKTLGASSDAPPIDLEREKINLEFSNFEINPEGRTTRGSQTPQVEKTKRREQKSRKTLGASTDAPPIDLEREKINLEFSNFEMNPEGRTTQGPQTPQVEKVKQRTEKSRKTLGASADASPIDLEREKMNLEFSNFEMNPEGRTTHGSQTPQVEKVKRREQRSRKTLGATTETSPIDLEREKMNLEFSNFEMNPKGRTARGLSELFSNPARLTVSRRTTGKLPLNPGFDLQAEKDRRNLSIEFENFEPNELKYNSRGRSLAPGKIEETEAATPSGHRRTMGSKPITETFDITKEVERYNMDLEFENFDPNDRIEDRGQSQSFLQETEPKTSHKKRLTVGQSPLTDIFDVEAEVRRLEFKNFQVAPNIQKIRGQSLSPSAVAIEPRAIAKDRRTLGDQTYSDFNIEEERIKLLMASRKFEEHRAKSEATEYTEIGEIGKELSPIKDKTAGDEGNADLREQLSPNMAIESVQVKNYVVAFDATKAEEKEEGSSTRGRKPRIRKDAKKKPQEIPEETTVISNDVVNNIEGEKDEESRRVRFGENIYYEIHQDSNETQEESKSTRKRRNQNTKLLGTSEKQSRSTSKSRRALKPVDKEELIEEDKKTDSPLVEEIHQIELYDDPDGNKENKRRVRRGKKGDDTTKGGSKLDLDNENQVAIQEEIEPKTIAVEIKAKTRNTRAKLTVETSEVAPTSEVQNMQSDSTIEKSAHITKARRTRRQLVSNEDIFGSNIEKPDLSSIDKEIDKSNASQELSDGISSRSKLKRGQKVAIAENELLTEQPSTVEEVLESEPTSKIKSRFLRARANSVADTPEAIVPKRRNRRHPAPKEIDTEPNSEKSDGASVVKTVEDSNANGVSIDETSMQPRLNRGRKAAVVANDSPLPQSSSELEPEDELVVNKSKSRKTKLKTAIGKPESSTPVKRSRRQPNQIDQPSENNLEANTAAGNKIDNSTLDHHSNDEVPSQSKPTRGRRAAVISAERTENSTPVKRSRRKPAQIDQPTESNLEADLADNKIDHSTLNYHSNDEVSSKSRATRGRRAAVISTEPTENITPVQRTRRQHAQIDQPIENNREIDSAENKTDNSALDHHSNDELPAQSKPTRGRCAAAISAESRGNNTPVQRTRRQPAQIDKSIENNREVDSADNKTDNSTLDHHHSNDEVPSQPKPTRGRRAAAIPAEPTTEQYPAEINPPMTDPSSQGTEKKPTRKTRVKSKIDTPQDVVPSKRTQRKQVASAVESSEENVRIPNLSQLPNEASTSTTDLNSLTVPHQRLRRGRKPTVATSSESEQPASEVEEGELGAKQSLQHAKEDTAASDSLLKRSSKTSTKRKMENEEKESSTNDIVKRTRTRRK